MPKAKIDLSNDRPAIEKLITDSITKFNAESPEPAGSFALYFSPISGWIMSALHTSPCGQKEGDELVFATEIPVFSHFEFMEIEMDHWRDAAESEKGAQVTCLDGSKVKLDPDMNDDELAEPFTDAVERILSDAIARGTFIELRTTPGFHIAFEEAAGAGGRIWTADEAD